MRKRFMMIFLVFFLLPQLPVMTNAAGEGSIRILLQGDGAPISGAEIRVYLAGTPIENGYRLTDTFGAGMITQLDVFSPELAAWLAQRSSGGWRETTGSDGVAFFPALDEGLYLVTQPDACGGYSSFEPFLVTIPWDGYQWDITAEPKTARQITVIPDTSDPGTVGICVRWMILSGTVLCALLTDGKRRKR